MFDSVWYNLLTKPLFTPPARVFAPVWTFIYLTIFVSFILFTLKRTRRSKIRGYIYFLVQMVLNIIWIPLFFILKNPGLALADIILLDIFSILTAKNFHKISKQSGLILIPYIIWLLFATWLNAGILFLN